MKMQFKIIYFTLPWNPLHYIPTCLVFIAMLACSCTTEQEVIVKGGITLSGINILINGATIETRPDMIDTCKGFLLTKQQVREFFAIANSVKDNSTGNEYNILPCFVSGSATINKDNYKWTIRSGGIGKFSGKNNIIIKVCGKECCKRLPGVC